MPWLRDSIDGRDGARADRDDRSVRKPAEKFLLVHAVLKRLAAVDENDRDFIIELAPELGVRVDIDFTPGKAAAARKFGKALFHHFAKVASLARVHDYIAQLWHAGKILARGNGNFPSGWIEPRNYKLETSVFSITERIGFL